MRKMLCLAGLLLAAGTLWGAVPDQQVLEWIRQAQNRNQTQEQIAQMLLERGVTREQMERLKESVVQQANTTGGELTTGDRMRVQAVEQQADAVAAQRPSETGRHIFGHNIFNNSQLSFEPALNIATPENYVLGPGDEVVVDVWGDSEQTIRQRISPDGNIVVHNIGPIYLNGLTVQAANARLKQTLARIYASVESDTPSTFTNLSLGQIRSIQVHVMGEVAVPGTYTVSALSTLFNVLYNAGGINDIGSLRSIKVNRHGRQVADVDIYSYLLEGRSDLNISLKDGDVVVVSPYLNLVEIDGKVKRPMTYELKAGQNVAQLIDYAGGFTGDAYSNAVRVIRQSGREHQVYNIDRADYGAFTLTDGDALNVGAVLSRFENRVEVKGAVYRPGLYALNDEVATVRTLVEKAEGLQGDAFTGRAVLYREKSDYSLEAEAVDITAVMNGSASDITLRRNDILYIPSIFDLREQYTVSVQGAVGRPGDYPHAENLTLEDAVLQAGGLLESASTVRVDVARRIKEPTRTTDTDQKIENYSFALRDGLVVAGARGFVLQPFDAVYVRVSPGYQTQQNVLIEGEVLFGGTYALAKKDQRLSDLVAQAGGITSGAYPQGAQLLRKMNATEIARYRSALQALAISSRRDSLSVGSLAHATTYYVGIELDKALQNPGSDDDIVLREGDILRVPEYSGTVKISGGVIYPNTVSYRKGASLSYYITQGGGYAPRVNRSKVFIVYLNGTLARAKGNSARIAPGCEVIVPLKPLRRERSLAEVLSIATSATSIAALVSSIVNASK